MRNGKSKDIRIAPKICTETKNLLQTLAGTRNGLHQVRRNNGKTQSEQRRKRTDRVLYGRNRLYRTGKTVCIESFHHMAQKKERTDEISFDSGNAVIYNQITNFQGNPKKVALFFLP